MQVHLPTNLDLKMIPDLVTAECKVYYLLYLTISKRLLLPKYPKSVSESNLYLNSLSVYSIVKLRLPDDLLMNALTDQVEAKIFKMSPKETALVSWALARSKLPSDTPLTKKLIASIYVHVNQIQKESYLYEQGSGQPAEEELTEMGDSIENQDCFMSQQTLAMFYWAVAYITNRESKVYKHIVKHLLTEEHLTLQTAGAIAHARKYYESRNLSLEYRQLIDNTLNLRLKALDE